MISGAGAPVERGLWCVDVADGTVVTVTGGAPVDADWYPLARSVTFDGPHGPVHAFDYAPLNPNETAPEGERPPYIVMVHGGPTAHVAGTASTAYAFWTSRGIGVLDVNYGGSTGYGRGYLGAPGRRVGRGRRRRCDRRSPGPRGVRVRRMPSGSRSAAVRQAAGRYSVRRARRGIRGGHQPLWRHRSAHARSGHA